MPTEHFPFIVHNWPESLLHAYVVPVEINPALPLLLMPILVNWELQKYCFCTADIFFYSSALFIISMI